MKKIKKLFFILILLVGGLSYQSFTDPGGGPVGGDECTFCKVSSDSSENTGHCTAGTEGDYCGSSGGGDACSETGTEPCDES